MAFIGLSTAFLGAVVADLRGTDQTRWFTRRAFGVVGIYEFAALAGGAVAELGGVGL